MIMRLPGYHEDLSALHVGCEEPRAYFIPFDKEDAAKSGRRETSSRFSLLSGEWQFRFFARPGLVPEDFPQNGLEAARTVLVPGNLAALRPAGNRPAQLYQRQLSNSV